MANLELTVGSPFRPIIDGIISKTGLPTPYGLTGTEYVGFTKQEMYITLRMTQSFLLSSPLRTVFHIIGVALQAAAGLMDQRMNITLLRYPNNF
jgi:hypothetical protein